MIFKIQSGEKGRALVCNRDKSIKLQVPVEKVSRILRGRPKVYASGSIMGRIVYFDRVVAERDW